MLIAPDLLPGSGPASTAYAHLDALFAAGTHRPSVEQWEAISDLLRHLQASADNLLDQAVYVSPIPAGTGKSTSLQAFAGALCDDPAYARVGMLILCNRVSECRDMANGLAAWRDKLHVIVSDKNPETLALGGQATADKAQVIVATQASLKASLRAVSDFDDANRFHYLGKRRAVVCWDEAIAFARPVALDALVIAGLSKAMSRLDGGPQAVPLLLRWAAEVAEMQGDGIVQVPDFAALMDMHSLEDAVEGTDLEAEAKALSSISGSRGYVKRDTVWSAAVVKAIPELPESLLPVTVTDASAARGVHHESYAQMALMRPVRYLREARKTYQNLTLRIVPWRASRSAFKDTKDSLGLELIELAVRYVREVAPEPVLLVSYKGAMTIKGVKEASIQAAIDARLTEEERGRIHHVTYGQHTATNEHATVRHVMMLGLNFLPRYAPYVASGAALEKAMDTLDPADHPTDQQVEAMRIGMLRDSTMQALLRGNARNGANGDCGEMEAVVVQAPQHGLGEDDWAGMFPGALYGIDYTLMPQIVLKGRTKDLADHVLGCLDLGLPDIPLAPIRAGMGMARQDFGKLLKRPDWKAWARAQGLSQVTRPGNALALVRVGWPLEGVGKSP